MKYIGVEYSDIDNNYIITIFLQYDLYFIKQLIIPI